MWIYSKKGNFFACINQQYLSIKLCTYGRPRISAKNFIKYIYPYAIYFIKSYIFIQRESNLLLLVLFGPLENNWSPFGQLWKSVGYTTDIYIYINK